MIRVTAARALAVLRAPVAAAVVAVGLALVSAPAASAQNSRGGMAAMFIPDFLPRDLPVFVDSLGLEEWQRPILEALLEDYGTNFATAADGVRSSMGQLKDVAANTDPNKIVELITKPLITWGAEKKALRADFLESVKSQLSDVQAESWPRLERALRREKALPNGELSGESLNLVMIARETDASPLVAENARPAIEEYEIKLDAALEAREAELEAAIGAQLAAMVPNDPKKLLTISERTMRTRVAVRAVQDASLLAIRDALGAEYGPGFEKRALRRAFPQVYGPDPVTPLFEAANALPDLTPEQKTKLAELRARFDTDHGALQSRYADVIRTTEPNEPRRRASALEQKMAGGTATMTEAPEMDAIKGERGELYTRYRALIADILNDEQKELVPGFGKPGADLGNGQKYNDAVHLGSGGGEKRAPNSGAIDSVGDPAKSPRQPDSTKLNQTKSAVGKPPKSNKPID